jgi:3-phosphoshikimate 1-carboxyvinyltransferase
VLAVLCALAASPSEINGVGHLKYKESSRLDRSRELVEWMGARLEGDDTSVKIHPTRSRPVGGNKWIFKADQDHRMAMAARVAEWAGFPLQVDDMEVVAKSFPEFLQISAGPGVSS